MSGRYTNDYHNVKNRYLAAGPTRKDVINYGRYE